MAGAVTRWVGEPDAVAAAARLSADGRRIKVACLNGHDLVMLYATPAGPLAVFQPVYDVGENYQALFPDDLAPDLVGQRREDKMFTEARFLTGEPIDAWCRCRSVAVDPEWLRQEFAAGKRRVVWSAN
jgi:hypothetical protein